MYKATMGKIIFYEDRDFKGGYYECSNDCPDLYSYFKRCNSIRVESGAFVVYNRPNYAGYQYFLKRGDYNDNHHLLGNNDAVRSCRMVPMHRGNYQIQFYMRPNMSGQMMELSEDCPNFMERFHFSEANSCTVMEGHWLLYEQPNYRGQVYYLRPGEYRTYRDWGGVSSQVGSVRRITDY